MNLWKEGNWQTIHFTNQTIPLNKLDPEDTTTVHCALYLLHVYKAAKNSEIKKKLQQFLRCSAAMKTQKDEITYALENYNFKLFLCTFHQFLFFICLMNFQEVSFKHSKYTFVFIVHMPFVHINNIPSLRRNNKIPVPSSQHHTLGYILRFSHRECHHHNPRIPHL